MTGSVGRQGQTYCSALATDERRTILVVLGDVQLPSDLDGRHIIRLSNKSDSRKKLKDALVGVGCAVSESGPWHDPAIAGDFETCLKPPVLPELDGLPSFGMSVISPSKSNPRGATKLSPEGEEILLEAATKGGSILTVLHSGGYSVVVQGHDLIREHTPRSEAKYRAAIGELLALGLLEPLGSGGEVLQVTSQGFSTADEISVANRS